MARRLFNTMLNHIRRKRTADRHMGTAASGLSEEVPKGYIHQSSHKRQAQERFKRLIEGMKQEQGITEQLKAENALEWTGRVNNIRACARGIVNNEIIFV